MGTRPPAEKRQPKRWLIERNQAASLVRTIGTTLAQMCDSPEFRLWLTGISGLIATAITWRSRRSQ